MRNLFAIIALLAISISADAIVTIKNNTDEKVSYRIHFREFSFGNSLAANSEEQGSVELIRPRFSLSFFVGPTKISCPDSSYTDEAITATLNYDKLAKTYNCTLRKK